MSQGCKLWMLAIAALLSAPLPAFAATAKTEKSAPKAAAKVTKPVAGTKRTYNIREAYQKERLREMLELVRQEEADRRVAEDKKTREEQYLKEQEDAKRREENGEEPADAKEGGASRAAARSVEDGDAETEASAAPAPEPTLVINYDKHYVSVDRQLRQLLQEAERSKHTPHYEIVSEVPADSMGGRRNYISNSKYERNLDDLVRRFRELGVQSSRITVSSRPADGITAQKVSIYEN